MEMKVLFLSAANSVHTIRWVNALAGRGHEVHLVYNKGHNPKKDAIAENVILHELKYGGMKGYYFNALEVRKLKKLVKPDIVNVHYASGYGTLARKGKIGPILLSIWGSDVYEFPYESIIKNKILKKNIKYASMIASTSHCMAEQLRSLMESPEMDIKVTPFGVDVDLFNPDAFTKQDLGRIRIGTIKALKPKYGIKELILSIDLLMKDEEIEDDLKSQIRVEIYGEGEQKSELMELVNKLRLDEIISFKGRIPNSEVPSKLSQMEIFCAFSQQESFGVAVVEAMAMSVPVVVTDVDGFKEVVENEKTGIIVQGNNIKEYKNAIKKLVLDAQLRKLYGVNGRNRVIELYDWEKNVGMMERLYKSFIERKLSKEKYDE